MKKLRDSGAARMTAVIGLCALAGLPLLPLSGSAAAVYALLGSTTLALIAGAMCWLAARRAEGSIRAGWALLATACLGWGLGNVYWSLNELLVHADVLFLSPADFGFVIFPVAGGAGLWLISGRSSLGSRLAGLLDGLTVALALFTISWIVTLRSVWAAGGDNPWAFVVSLVYPVGDLVLATMAFLLATRIRRGARTVVGLLVAGLLGMATADTLFALATADGRYVSGTVADAGWVIAFAAFALAGWISARQPMSLQASGVIRRWQVMLPYVPFGAAAVISAAQVATGALVDGVQAISLLAGFALIMSRQLVTLMHNSRLTQQLRFQAFHDPLTGLGNRALFTDRLADVLAARVRAGGTPTVLYLDLDDFKLINDTLGHDAGDALLCAVADRLRTAFPDADTIARLGGDEFVVLIAQAADPAERAQRMLDHLREPFRLGAHRVAVTASVGTAAAPGRVTAEDLRKNVDLAMYAAKGRGKNAYAVFEPSMRDSFDAEMAMREDLQRALAEDALSVVYQPIAGLGDGRVVGVEALARWHDPVRGTVPPAEFIPVAERAAMISDIGGFVLDRACAEFAAWPGAAGTYLSVNVSPLQLLDPSFPERVLSTIRRHGLLPDHLVLEVTEHALADESYVIPALHRLRAAGLRTAIDDFGTGYSSLRYLHRLPADIIKIDRSYIRDINRDTSAGRLVETLWQLFSALGLTAIAEGVEDPPQARMLAEMGCPMAQGYLFGRPVPIERLATPDCATAR
ncbi:MAG TPA: EAL domain-containing protein [Actinoplanes sp.]|nr:EAL domain-containing protein [Actinoplanes sp.]